MTFLFYELWLGLLCIQCVFDTIPFSKHATFTLTILLLGYVIYKFEWR
jgi:hypothetical protein